MQTAYDVELCDGLGVTRRGGLECLFQRHGVCPGSVLLAAKGAQAAGGNADIGGIDMAIDVEVSLVPVQALANVIRKPADSQNVSSAIKSQSIFLSKALAGKDFLCYRF